MAKKKEVGYNVMEHDLVPNHIILTDKEANEVFSRLKITKDQLPKIRITDPCIKHLERHGDPVKEGSVVRIIRNSKTAGIAVAYRLIIRG